MDKNQKVLLVMIGLFMIAAIGVVAYNVFMPKPVVQPNEIEVSERVVEEEPAEPETPAANEENKSKEYVNIYFIGRNEKNEEVYKAVKRIYSKDVDGSKLKFAVYSLVGGPKLEEKNKGVYTEIPSASQVINISEKNDKIIINLSSSFVDGGGADSLYKRLYQLIKTVKLNTKTPTYLYIDGKQADVIGGEGIMITQPLSDKSLDN